MKNIPMSSPRNYSTIWRPWLYPTRLLRRFVRPYSPGVYLVNFIFQRILGIHNEVPWPVHFTSCVSGDISIGRNVWKSFATSGSCYIQGRNGITIGDDTIFAYGVSIISANHNSHDYSKWDKCRPIEIGNKCWLGRNATILPGVVLGDRVIVAAGSVVTKSFEGGCVIAGVPAKIIKKLDEEQE